MAAGLAAALCAVILVAHGFEHFRDRADRSA
jgi:hypothetical protein